MTIAFSAWSQNLISSFRFPWLPQRHGSERACRQRLAFRRENQSARQAERVAAWGGTGAPATETSLSEAFQLSLKGLHLEITLRGKKKTQGCLLTGETRVIRGDYSHYCNIA